MTRNRELALAQLNLCLLAEVPLVELPQDRERELSLALANLLLSAAGTDTRCEIEGAADGESKADA
jgi:hypothetical protein